MKVAATLSHICDAHTTCRHVPHFCKNLITTDDGLPEL